MRGIALSPTRLHREACYWLASRATRRKEWRRRICICPVRLACVCRSRVPRHQHVPGFLEGWLKEEGVVTGVVLHRMYWWRSSRSSPMTSTCALSFLMGKSSIKVTASWKSVFVYIRFDVRTSPHQWEQRGTTSAQRSLHGTNGIP